MSDADCGKKVVGLIAAPDAQSLSCAGRAETGRMDRDPQVRLTSDPGERGGVARWAFHDGKDLGKVQIAQIARQLGYTRDELPELL
jgi:hypothetical protein